MSRNGIKLLLALSILCLILSFFCLEGREDTEVSTEETEITVIETEIEEEETPIPKDRVLQDCVITAYCCENYPHICNDGDATYTATMTTPTPGRTIAVDPRHIPYGTEVEIDGIEGTFIAEDCGGAIKGDGRIDLLFATHEEALQWGIQHRQITIKG